ncbi:MULTISPECIES: hypothetical protein [Methanosarcina]|uniref:hypothetical protein n=1 Tax=Methanosarcina TaxID=2207 RepID=UPI000A4D6D99|nr:MULTISPECIES: hypothetical protein [Methanosarcina]
MAKTNEKEELDSGFPQHLAELVDKQDLCETRIVKIAEKGTWRCGIVIIGKFCRWEDKI